MRKVISGLAALALVVGVSVSAQAEDLVVPVNPNPVVNPVDPLAGRDYTTPPQYADAGNGLVVELPRYNPDGSAYRHGIDPLPIVPNPRSLSELGLDSATPLQTLADNTIVPLGYYNPQPLPADMPMPPRFTAGDFKKLTSDQISNMQAGDFSQLPAEVLSAITESQARLLHAIQLATLSPSDAVALMPLSVVAILPSEFGAIPAKSFASFKPAVIDELTVEHLDSLTTKHFAALKAAQVAEFDADQVEGFDPADLRALPVAVVGKLKSALLAAMTDEQLEAFKLAQVRKITKAQKKALTGEQLKVLAD